MARHAGSKHSDVSSAVKGEGPFVMPPNKSLQQSVGHKVLGRGWTSLLSLRRSYHGDTVTV